MQPTGRDVIIEVRREDIGLTAPWCAGWTASDTIIRNLLEKQGVALGRKTDYRQFTIYNPVSSQKAQIYVLNNEFTKLLRMVWNFRSAILCRVFHWASLGL